MMFVPCLFAMCLARYSPLKLVDPHKLMHSSLHKLQYFHTMILMILCSCNIPFSNLLVITILETTFWPVQYHDTRTEKVIPLVLSHLYHHHKMGPVWQSSTSTCSQHCIHNIVRIIFTMDCQMGFHVIQSL